MTPEEIDAWLARSLEDGRLSRSERQELNEFAATLGEADREEMLRRAFEAARRAMARPEDAAVVSWLEAVASIVRDRVAPGEPGVAEAYFSPGEGCPRAIVRLLGHARRTADVCVFTITDDRLADAILDAHGRGVSVRVLTDDAKAEDLGSDVDRLAQAGVPVRVDRSPSHMHHKFAVIDAAVVLTGSYNWTRGAARDNQENLIVADDPRLVNPFVAAFERLWQQLAG